MDSRDLEYVLTIARTGSFSQAARQLFISQPALSQYIKRLEKNLDVTLFYRSRSRVELSPAGMFYVKQGEAILKAMQELAAEGNETAEHRGLPVLWQMVPDPLSGKHPAAAAGLADPDRGRGIPQPGTPDAPGKAGFCHFPGSHQP